MASIPHAIARITAGVGLVVAVTSHGWLVNAVRELHGGLLSFDSGGESWSNGELVEAALANGSQHASKLFAPAGQATFALGLIAAALLIASIVTASRWVRRAALAALGLALAGGIVFLATKPTGPAFGVGTGWAALVFVVAAAAGAFSCIRAPTPDA